MIEDAEWPAQWLRGVLELCVLALVCREETYGYAISQQLEEAGLGRLKGGTLYPILLRLEQDGLVAAQWREGEGGPGRKFFRATDEGHRALRARARRWAAFSDVTAAVLTGAPPPGAAAATAPTSPTTPTTPTTSTTPEPTTTTTR